MGKATLTEGDDIDQSRADEVFDSLDDYGKFELARCGTAFTTYEELGDNVCSWLNARARAWLCSQGGR